MASRARSAPFSTTSRSTRRCSSARAEPRVALVRVMISCGEPSGDLYAGALASEILRIERSAVIIGLGGDRLKAAGASLVGDFSGLSVTGLLEVARVLPRTAATYRGPGAGAGPR